MAVLGFKQIVAHDLTRFPAYEVAGHAVSFDKGLTGDVARGRERL